MEPPIKDGDKLRDWEGDLCTVRNVRSQTIGPFTDYHFDAWYGETEDEMVPNYVFTDQFTHVTEESN